MRSGAWSGKWDLFGAGDECGDAGGGWIRMWRVVGSEPNGLEMSPNGLEAELGSNAPNGLGRFAEWARKARRMGSEARRMGSKKRRMGSEAAEWARNLAEWARIRRMGSFRKGWEVRIPGPGGPI